MGACTRSRSRSMAEPRMRLDGRSAAVLALLAGLAALGIAMAAGLAPELLGLVAGPPPLVRAGLAGLAIVVGGKLLLSAVRRIDGSVRRGAAGEAGRVADADLGAMVRGVRLAFLAVASFTAAAGWLLGEPLPLVIALVIAGVDVVETSFLLLVAGSARLGRPVRDDPAGFEPDHAPEIVRHEPRVVADRDHDKVVR